MIIFKYLWLEAPSPHHWKSRVMQSRADVRKMGTFRNRASHLSSPASFTSSWHVAPGLQDGCCNSRPHVFIQGIKKLKRVCKTAAVLAPYFGKSTKLPGLFVYVSLAVDLVTSLTHCKSARRSSYGVTLKWRKL